MVVKWHWNLPNEFHRVQYAPWSQWFRRSRRRRLHRLPPLWHRLNNGLKAICYWGSFVANQPRVLRAPRGWSQFSYPVHQGRKMVGQELENRVLLPIVALALEFRQHQTLDKGCYSPSTRSRNYLDLLPNRETQKMFPWFSLRNDWVSQRALRQFDPRAERLPQQGFHAE